MSFEELEREVRQDLMAERWRKYRPGVIALVVSVLGAVAGYKAYQYYQQQAEIQAAQNYYNATQVLLQDQESGLAALEIVMQDKGALGYQALAQLKLAAEYITAKDFEPAQAVLLDLADNPETPDFLVASASIQATLIPTAPETHAALLLRLEPFLRDDSPWRHAARIAATELTLKSGQQDKALDILQRGFDDPETPQSSRARINKLLTILK